MAETSTGSTSEFEQLLRSFEKFRKDGNKSRISLASSRKSRKSLANLDVTQFLKDLLSPKYLKNYDANGAVAKTTKAASLNKELEEEVNEVASIISTGKFPAGNKRYPFTFKLMIHKLYALEDWAQKVKGVLATSQKHFRPLGEEGIATAERIFDNSHGEEEGLQAGQCKGASRKLLTIRARSHSNAGQGKRRENSSPLSPTSPTRWAPSSPMKAEFSHLENARAVKKRCVGRRKSLGAISAGDENSSPLGSWVYDAAASSLESPDTVSRRRAHAENSGNISGNQYGDLEGPGKMPRTHKRRVSSATGEWKGLSAAQDKN